MLILVYIFLSIFYMDKWAYSEVPLGSANAWPEGGESRNSALGFRRRNIRTAAPSQLLNHSCSITAAA